MPSARKYRCNSDCHWLITERWNMQESHFNGCAFDWFPLCSKLILAAFDWTNTNQRETAIKSQEFREAKMTLMNTYILT